MPLISPNAPTQKMHEDHMKRGIVESNHPELHTKPIFKWRRLGCESVAGRKLGIASWVATDLAVATGRP